MRILRFVALAAIAVVATSCSGKCEQDNAALQKRVDSLKAENADLRNTILTPYGAIPFET